MWIELTSVYNGKQMYYFGHSGIINVYTYQDQNINQTWLIYANSGIQSELVIESYDYIKDILLNNQGTK